MKTNFWNPRIRFESANHGFTIVELLVVIAVIAALILFQVTALTGVSRQSRAAQCASNLRQFALVTQIYAHENRDQLPPATGGFWAWDLPTGAVDSLVRYGTTRNRLYCPANPDQNADGLWNYSGAIRIIGYVTTFPGVSLSSTNLNSSIVPQSIPAGPAYYPPPTAANRVLLADVVISQPGQNDASLRNTYLYTGVVGGYGPPGWPGHRTSHLNNRLPSGGNVAMLDGHVEWRPFTIMIPRVTDNSVPAFWW